ncbi:MAG: hypothetical protein ACHRXM_18065 [Isosphaerales bacterium]
MKRRLALTLIVASLVPATSGQNQRAETMPSYPIEIAPEKVYEFRDLNIGVRDLRLNSNAASVVPISCERGITGIVLIGNGTFRYTPEGGKLIEGQFRAAMLRFNPEDQALIVPLDKGTKVIDRGAAEMSRHLLSVVFGHCWHSGKQALIPTKDSISAVLYSKDHGDLLISADKQTAIVYNFTDRKTLYQRK